jgi:hypothetical protein
LEKGGEKDLSFIQPTREISCLAVLRLGKLFIEDFALRSRLRRPDT